MAGGSLYKGDEDEAAITDINVTPFVDVALVLLIIFIVTAKLIVGRGVEVNKPAAAAGGEVPSVTRVSVDRDGKLYVNGEPFTDKASAVARVRVLTSQMTDPAVLIEGDEAAAYGGVMRAIDVVHAAEITKIVLENKPPADSPGGAN